MAMTVSELQVKVSADTSDAEKGLSSLGTSVTNAGKSLAGIATGAAVAGLAGLAAGLTASVVAAAGFEQQMSAISAVSGATADEMALLSEKALQLGADTSFSASEAAAGMNELIKAGVSVEDVLGGGAAAALSLAAAGGLSVAESAEIASNAMNVFSLSGADVGHVADVIAGAANASAIDVHDFGMSLAASGAVAATVGIGFDDLGTAIAVMGQAGIKGSDAGTSLKTMLLNLTPSTKAQIAVAKELGIVTADGANRFFDQEGKARSLGEIAEVLRDSTEGLTEQQKLMALQTLFGTDAIRAAAIMAKEGGDGFANMAQSIGKVTAEAVAAERLNNLKGDIEQLTGSLETAGIKIGTAFLPGLRSITQGATELVNQAAPILEAFAKRASSAIEEASRQIQDAWRTAKQAFAGEWLPSDDIPPFVNAVGQAATKIRELSEEGKTVAGVLGDMGVVDDFRQALGTAADEAATLKDAIDGLKGSLDILHDAFGGTEGEATALGVGLKAVAAAVDIAFLASGELIDIMLTMATAAVDLTSMVVSAGRAIVAFASGDMAAMEAALASGDAAFANLMTAVEGFGSRSTARMSQAMTDIAGVVTSGMGQTQAATESGMQGAVAAIEAAAPAAEAAGAQVGQAAASGVEGQAGAASAAGASVGDSIGSGMLAGIRGWVGSIASAAANLVSSAIGAARAEADAHSPSKKTEQLGKDMAKGLELGLNSSNIGAEMQAKIRDFIAASREYIPTAREIARVEAEIKTIREESQTEALFRAEKMITLDSEVLRLKEAEVRLERDSIGLRQDLAAATRELADIQRGTLADRTRLIEMDTRQAANRITLIGLERELADAQAVAATAAQARVTKLTSAEQDLGSLRQRLDNEAEARAKRLSRAEEALGDLKERFASEAETRASVLVGFDQRSLELKRDLARAELDLIPTRQRLADLAGSIADIERGSVADQKELLLQQRARNESRLKQLAIEQQLALLADDDPRVASLKQELDVLHKQDEARARLTEQTRLANEIASVGAKLQQIDLENELRQREKNSAGIKSQAELVSAQQAAQQASFAATESIMQRAAAAQIRAQEAFVRSIQEKNDAVQRSADKELRAREQLVAAMREEGKASDRRVEAIGRAIAELQRQNAAMQTEAEMIRANQTIASASARVRREGLDDQVRGYDTLIGNIKNQIDVLGAERAVFEANEAIIKNATDNEIAYRNRLIAVFNAEGKPLADRITVGRALLEQLHNEGRISDELYNAVKRVTDQAKEAGQATVALGQSAAIAAPSLNSAAGQADRMAQEAADLARQAAIAEHQMSELARQSAEYARQRGSLFDPRPRAAGGPVISGSPYLVGEAGPELFVPRVSGQIIPADVTQSWMSGGPLQEHRVNVRINGQAAADIYVTGREVAIRYGRASS